MPPQQTPASYTPERWKRSTPLARCPDLACKREGRCLGLALGGNCIKTFHTDPDGWAGDLAEKINAFCDKFERDNPGYVPRVMTDEEAMHEVKQAIEERAAELRAMDAAALAKPAPSRKTRLKQGR